MNAIDHQTYQSPASSTIRTLEYLFTKYQHELSAPIEHSITLKSTDLRRMADEDKANALRLYNQGNGLSPQAIGDQLGFSCAAITGFLHRVGARKRLTK
jgi:hypothetical protein